MKKRKMEKCRKSEKRVGKRVKKKEKERKRKKREQEGIEEKE